MKDQIEKHARFIDFPIDVNGNDISDVIIMDSSGWKNMKTGETSKLLRQVIRKDHCFITLDVDNVHFVYGYYVKYIPELDVLALVHVRYNYQEGKWDEFERAYLEKAEPCPKAFGSFSMHDDFIDIRGQIIFPYGMKSLVHRNHYDVKSVGSKKECFEYFGRCMNLYIIEGDILHYDSTFYYSSSLEIARILEISKSDGYDYENDEMCKLLTNVHEEHCGNAEAKDISKDVRDRLISMAKTYAKSMRGRENNWVDEGLTLRYMNRAEDCWLLRDFAVVYYHNSETIDDADIELYETSRIGISKETTRDDYIWQSFLAAKDNVKDDILPYKTELIDKWLSWLDENGAGTESVLEFYKKYGYNQNADLMVFYLNKIPLIEKMWSYEGEGAKELRKFIMRLFNFRISNLSFALEEAFGSICREDGPLNQMLGIPKGMLGHLASNDELELIQPIKETFHTSDEGISYLQNMNEADYKYLINFFNCDIGQAAKKSFMLLVKIFGHKNWKGYTNFLMKLDGDIDTVKYLNYLNTLAKIGDAAKKADWKLTGKALDKSLNSVTKIMFMMRDYGDMKGYAKKFEEFSKQWEKYEYEDDKYVIKYPTVPSDILYEGFCLKHCVKEFLGRLGANTTTILFIRKRENPDKPFYTLEVRGDIIRQCHGFDNCNVEKEGENLLKFIENFSEEKNLILNIEGINELKGV